MKNKKALAWFWVIACGINMSIAIWHYDYHGAAGWLVSAILFGIDLEKLY